VAHLDVSQFRGLARLAALLGAAETRIVGGAVRDFLAGQEVHDIDVATCHSPETVIERLAAAHIKCVPTGIAHGTITALMAGETVEITTLRKDVSTDGRRATIAYTSDWREDAMRRDFTINALYADLATGEIFDYFGGLDDLQAGLVRFIGDPLERIAEDHLRILRFFRFHARYGHTTPDGAALAACTARANDLMALSRERIADEVMKLLALPTPAATVALMIEAGIFKPVLPEIVSAAGLALLPPSDAIRRLASVLPAQPEIVDTVAKRLKLSKAITKRLVLAAGRTASDATGPRGLAYRLGRQAAEDRLNLSGEILALGQLEGWEIPVFPLSGGALVKRGLREGPAVAHMLKRIEEHWINEGFPDAQRVAEITDRIVAEIK
jgi:poly(A) polymerase